MAKVIWQKPVSPRTRIVQSYSPGGATVHNHPSHGSCDPCESAPPTGSRSVQRFCICVGTVQSNTARHTDHRTCDICSNSPHQALVAVLAMSANNSDVTLKIKANTTNQTDTTIHNGHLSVEEFLPRCSSSMSEIK